MCVSLSMSLSLSMSISIGIRIYIYIYMYMCIYIPPEELLSKPSDEHRLLSRCRSRGPRSSPAPPTRSWASPGADLQHASLMNTCVYLYWHMLAYYDIGFRDHILLTLGLDLGLGLRLRLRIGLGLRLGLPLGIRLGIYLGSRVRVSV